MPSSYDRVLGSRAMPGAEWFPGARLNYAGHMLRDKPGERVALIGESLEYMRKAFPEGA